MTQAQAQWIMEENQRLDQQIIDQQYENEVRRQVLNQSLLTSKKNAKAYRG
ncbi:MAG: hypothetical protein ACTSRK_11100 [Promethearchaeota archaeon]